MKFSLKIFVSDYKKALPFYVVKREQSFYPTPYKILLNWNSMTFVSEKHHDEYATEMPVLSVNLPDDTLFSNLEKICKDISIQLDCLVYGQRCSKYAQVNFQWCYEKGVKMTSCSLCNGCQDLQRQTKYKSFHKILLIRAAGKDWI